MQRPPTFVLVHGAFANSFSFAPLQAELALLGHRSLAVDLPGHGFEATFPAAYQAPQDFAALATAPGGLSRVTLADGVARVIEVLERAKRNGPTILVGHSRGGITITAVGNARPDLVDRLVYVSAWCPVELTVGGLLRRTRDGGRRPGGPRLGAPREPGRTGPGAHQLPYRRPGDAGRLQGGPRRDLTDDEFRAFLNTFQPDENLDVGTSADRARAATWGRIPRTYVRLAEDASVPPAIQDRMIREADALTPDNPFDVRTLESGHLRWLVHPRPAAELLTGLAES